MLSKKIDMYMKSLKTTISTRRPAIASQQPQHCNCTTNHYCTKLSVSLSSGNDTRKKGSRPSRRCHTHEDGSSDDDNDGITFFCPLLLLIHTVYAFARMRCMCSASSVAGIIIFTGSSGTWPKRLIPHNYIRRFFFQSIAASTKTSSRMQIKHPNMTEPLHC